MEENEQYSLKEELERTLAGEAAEALRDRDSTEKKAEGSQDKAPVLSLQEEIEREDALSLQEEEDLLEALLFSLGRTVSLEEMAICLHILTIHRTIMNGLKTGPSHAVLLRCA